MDDGHAGSAIRVGGRVRHRYNDGKLLLAAGRTALLKHTGWDVEEDGLFGAPPIRVAVGEEVHISVLKALSLLGLGRSRLTRVPVDGQGRMRPGALPRLDDHTVVCIQAGNVNTGAFDPAGGHLWSCS